MVSHFHLPLSLLSFLFFFFLDMQAVKHTLHSHARMQHTGTQQHETDDVWVARSCANLSWGGVGSKCYYIGCDVSPTNSNHLIHSCGC